MPEDKTEENVEVEAPEVETTTVEAAEEETPDVVTEPAVSADAADKPKPKAKSKLQTAFDTALAAFEKATLSSKEAALLCANMAMDQFFAHGTLNMAQDFADACDKIGKNYIRKAAFEGWMKKYAPITKIAGRYKKDITRESFTADALKTMKAIPFWDAIPSPEKVSFTEDDVVKSMTTWINGWNSRQASTGIATKKVEAIAKAVRPLLAEAS